MKTDLAGNVVESWDAYPYGETWSGGAPGDAHRYTGYLRDAESGNDYAGARYYSNSRGRWLSMDPVLGDISNPQQLNRYGYVLSDPINLVDPDGANPAFWWELYGWYVYWRNNFTTTVTAVASGGLQHPMFGAGSILGDQREVPDVMADLGLRPGPQLTIPCRWWEA